MNVIYQMMKTIKAKKVIRNWANNNLKTIRISIKDDQREKYRKWKVPSLSNWITWGRGGFNNYKFTKRRRRIFRGNKHWSCNYGRSRRGRRMGRGLTGNRNIGKKEQKKE